MDKSANVSCDVDESSVTIFLEELSKFRAFFGSVEQLVKDAENCTLNKDIKCHVITDSDHATQADVAFWFVSFIKFYKPIRHCKSQLVAILNSEAETSSGRELLNSADIRIDHHMTSEVFLNHICGLQQSSYPIEAKKRKGIALFLSNCLFIWRYFYLYDLMKYIHIDSYGGCLHNTKVASDRRGKWEKTFLERASQYRMVIIFENRIQKEYISEKLAVVYKSGAIPVYWGPSDVYQWIPGNNTIIDASKYADPKELANYLKRVLAEDSLHEYHTTFDWEKTNRMQKKYCKSEPYICQLCKVAQKKLDKL